MKYIMAKPARLYCNTCDETFALPTANGNIKLHQELKCPLDDFEILYFTAGAKGKVMLMTTGSKPWNNLDRVPFPFDT